MSGEKKRGLKRDFEQGLKRIKLFSSSSGDPGPPAQSTQRVDPTPTPVTDSHAMLTHAEPSSLLPSAPPPTVDPYDSVPSRPVSSIPAPRTFQRSAKHERWVDFKEFAKTLRQGLNSFGPLKQAIDTIAKGIEISETAAQNRVDYENLREDLNLLFHDLAEFFDASTPPTMAPTIINFAKGIDQELEAVRVKLSETRIGTHKTNADNILEHNRRIQVVLQRLTSNVGIKTLRIADEQATESWLKSLPHSPAAKYNSAESSDLRGRCTQNTRVDLLEDIYVVTLISGLPLI